MNPTFILVAAVFAVFVLMARTTSLRLPPRVAIFFYAAVLVFLFRPMVLDYVAIPVDQLERLPPWRSDPDFEVHNSQTNDVSMQIVPWAHLVRESWTRLEAPLWNHTAQGGYPLLANMQSSAFSPFRLVTLPLDLGDAMTAEAALKLLVALWFAFVFARRRGAGDLAATITAVSWSFSTAIMVWLHFPLATTLVHLPMTLVALDLLLERVSWGRFCFTTFAFLSLLINGHPESAAHIVTVAAAWLLFRMIRDGWPVTKRAAAAAIGAGILALLIAAPLLFPFFEVLPFSKRWVELDAFRDHRGGRFYWGFLMNFLHPEFFGSVTENTAWGPAHAEVIMGWSGVLAVAAFVGWGALAVRDRLWRHDATFFSLLTILLCSVAIHTPWLTRAFESLPLYSMIANGRFRFLFCWTGALLLGLLVQRALDGDRRPLQIGVVSTVVIFAAVFLGHQLALGTPADRVLIDSAIAAIPSFIVLIVAAIALFLSRSPLWFAALIVAITAELLAFGWSWNTTMPSSAFYPETPAIQKLEALIASDDLQPARIAGVSGALFPNTSAIYGFEDIRAHDPMSTARVLGMLRVYTGYTAESYFAMLGSYHHPILDFMGVRYVITPPGVQLNDSAWVMVWEGSDARIYRNDEAMPRFIAPRHTLMEGDAEERQALLLDHIDWRNAVVVNRIHSSLVEQAHDDIFGPRPDLLPPTEITILRSSPRRYDIEVDAQRWSVIASSLPAYPGWRVWTSSGIELPISEVNGGFIGFLVPPGTTHVRVDYRPRSFYHGLWVSGTALLGLAAWPVARRRSRVRR
ncbi:MAG: YfhO family protein [Acidobacteria bacterium]|nr:YfhO family protein [Acidobacteriota bacterium]